MVPNNFDKQQPNDKAKIQYQYLVLRWQDLCAQLPTEKLAVDRLFELMAEHGYIRCKYCQSSDLEPPLGQRFTKCRECRKKTWFTHKSFFHQAKRIRPYFFVFSLIDDKIPFNASQLSHVTGIAFSSALEILHKLGLVSAYQPGETTEVPSCFMAPAFRKRSLETPAKQKPIAEEEAIANSDQPISDQDGANYETTLAEFTEAERDIYLLLSDSPIHIDQLMHDLRQYTRSEVLNALLMLELNKFVTGLRGPRFIRRVKTVNEFAALDTLPESTMYIASSALAYTLQTHQGVSRKYIQLYIALFNSLVRPKDPSSADCFRRCFEFGPVHHEDIRAYVSPRMLEIATADLYDARAA